MPPAARRLRALSAQLVAGPGHCATQAIEPHGSRDDLYAKFRQGRKGSQKQGVATRY